MRFSHSSEVVEVPLCSLEQQQIETDDIPWTKNTQTLTLTSSAMNKTVDILTKINSYYSMCGPINLAKRTFAFGVFVNAEKSFSYDLRIFLLAYSLSVCATLLGTFSIIHHKNRSTSCSFPWSRRPFHTVHYISSGMQFPSSSIPLGPSMLTGSIAVFWPQCPC